MVKQCIHFVELYLKPIVSFYFIFFKVGLRHENSYMILLALKRSYVLILYSQTLCTEPCQFFSECIPLLELQILKRMSLAPHVALN